MARAPRITRTTRTSRTARTPAPAAGRVKSSRKKLGRGRRASTGIDIGTFSVKIVSLYGDDAGQIDIRKVTVVPLTPPAGPEYPEELHQRQKEALKEALKKHGRLEGTVVLGFPRDRVTVRYLTLPSSNPEELREMLYYDVERHVPFSMEELELTYQLMERLGDHESRLMMVCAPRKEIEPYMQMCQEVGIALDRIDMDVMGDAAAYSRSLSPEETAALVNFGRSSVNLSIIRNGQLLFSRSIPVSETRLMQGFPGAKSWRDLQGRVTAAGALNPAEREHFAAWVENLSLELLRSVSGFLCEAPGQKIDRMILFGGAGYFPAGPPRGLNLRIQTKTTIETAMNGELPPGHEYRGHEVATAVGLALRGLDKSGQGINLLPETSIQERVQKEKSTFRKNVAILMFMILSLLGGTAYLKWYEHYLEYAALENFYAERFQQAAELKQMQKKLNTVENYLNTRHSCLNVIQAVLEILPPKTYIQSMSFTKRRTLEIIGQVLSEKEVQVIFDALNSLRPKDDDQPFFVKVTTDSTIKNLDLGGVSNFRVHEFRITCNLWWEDTKKK